MLHYDGTMIDTVLQAIAEPRRREIMWLIHGVERSSGEIASFFNVSRPAVSQRIRVLEDPGQVTVRSVGTRRMYTCRQEGLAELRQYLEAFWDERLLLLRQAAEAEKRRSTDANTPGRRGR
ncbi:MAG: ArsR family transcriptional regulator [Chloroflexi bacterium]|nr:ArsR family transcriptional regulator [Chloroflexota bacterium]